MSDQRTVLVTGATGNIGRHIIATLAAAGHPVRAASRHRPTDPAAATSHVPFDWHDPATHQPAVDGVHAVYLMPPPASADPVGQVGAFLDLAQDAGVRRIVLLSSSAIRTGDPGPGQLPATVADRFPEWTVLRPSWFMQNFVGAHPHAHSILHDGEIVTATGDGRVGFIDAADIAAVAVRALTDPVPHNAEHLLTGPQTHSYAEVATMISEVCGRPVRHRTVDVDTMRHRLASFGIPDGFAALLAGMDAAIAAGAENRTTSTVADVTGRAPTSLRDFCTAHTGYWRQTVA
ncbi:NAD(P)H-binding protein [Solwaraspora sp. WMMD792]|uniref:NmrA family NAD(P)-binding protein n=1 Tax=Solwaraspora sp. WMMD792 TaxID=3016099 RepID=UPI002417B384|nr:NAD(P)H-binding protein [Solwaraspora sp. WMMD792]MDG4774641.1 NAD(P)H-binding protein [Solwaraspora sp. WMMD792]